VSICLGSLAACAPADHWAAFDVDWERKLEQRQQRVVDVPDGLTPEPRNRPPLPDLTAEGPVALSIEQAVVLALTNNRDLRVEQYSPVIAGAFELVERGAFDPQLFAEFEYGEETASETARATGEQFSVEGRDTDAAAGIRQRLPTGTDIEAVIEQDRSASNRAPEQQQARLGLTVTQQLLRGLGPAVNLAAVRQAELGTLASRYELRGFIEALLAETEIAYWQMVQAEREIAIFEGSLDIARKQLDALESQIELGTIAEAQAAPARAEVARREQALIDARAALTDRRLRLARLINPAEPASLGVELRATSSPTLDPQPITDAADRLSLAVTSRPDLAEAELRLEQDRLETIVTRNGLLPRLEVFATLGRSGFGDTFAGSFRSLDEDTYDASIGVRFSHLVGNRSAEGRDLAARATREQSAAAVANLMQLVRLDVRLALNEVERARQQITAAATTRRYERETVDAEIARFREGASTTLLVAQAQRDLLAAEIAEVAAVVAYRIALVRLYLAEGTLLDRRGIVDAGVAGDG